MSEPFFLAIGVGGAGGKIVDAAARRSGGELSALAIDTDAAALERLTACRTFALGGTMSDGLGSGGDVVAASYAARNAVDELRKAFDGVSIAVFVAGLGGGTGSGALPVLLRLASECNVATIVFSVKPFSMEGKERLDAANAAVRAIAGLGDLRLFVSNDELSAASVRTTLADAMERATEVLAAGIGLFRKLGSQEGPLTLDVAQALAIIRAGRGSVRLLHATASGPNRAEEANACLAADLEHSSSFGPSGAAKSALMGVIGGSDLRFHEIRETVSALSTRLSMGVPVRLSTILDPSCEGSLSIVVLLFRSWVEPDAASNASAAPAGSATTRFPETPGAAADSENFDSPTWARRHLRFPVH